MTEATFWALFKICALGLSLKLAFWMIRKGLEFWRRLGR